MRKALISMALLLCCAGTATATTYTFSGTAGSPPIVGSAIEDITISGKTLTILLNNTSPLSAQNAPAITGFGVGLSPDANFLSATLWAYSDKANTTPIDLLNMYKNGHQIGWQITQPKDNPNSVDLDYVPETVNGVNYGLYNPATVSGEASNPVYTEAKLILTFADDLTNNLVTSEYVRFQSLNGGSLKLYGEQTAPVPEPGTMMLLGAGFLGLAIYGKRRRNG